MIIGSTISLDILLLDHCLLVPLIFNHVDGATKIYQFSILTVDWKCHHHIDRLCYINSNSTVHD